MDLPKDPNTRFEGTPDYAELSNHAMRTAEVYRPNLMDRLFLFGRRIIESYRVDTGVVIFICVGVGVGIWRRPKARRVILKLSFPGNVFYHIVHYNNLDKYIIHLAHAKHKLKEMRT